MITKTDLLKRLEDILGSLGGKGERPADLIYALRSDIKSEGVALIEPEPCDCKCCQRHRAAEAKRAREQMPFNPCGVGSVRGPNMTSYQET